MTATAQTRMATEHPDSYVDFRGVQRNVENVIQNYLTLQAVERGEVETTDIGHHSLSAGADDDESLDAKDAASAET